MQLVDFSQIYIAGCTAFESDFQKGGDTKKMESIGRHIVLNTLKSYNQLWKKKYGELTICCDGPNLWRREYFPYYKAGRKKDREDSPLDWASIMSIGATLRQEIAEIFPWKVVQVDGAEGDDVIGILLKASQTEWQVQQGLEECPQEMLIISSDHDYRQGSKYKNYHQWSPIQKKAVPRADKNFLLEKIIRGDKGDGIPSVKCPDDFFVRENSGRAPSITQKFIDAFLANPDGSTLTEEERKNLVRNRKLIDFDYIPQHITDNVIETYNNFQVVGTKNKVMEYLMKNRCKVLLQEMHNFF